MLLTRIGIWQLWIGRCVFCSSLASRQFGGPQTDRAFDPSGSPLSETSVWRAVVRVLRSPLDAVSCTVFPAHCRVCNNPLLEFSFTPVCGACWNDLPPQSPDNLCEVCGEHLGWGDLRFAVQSASEAQEAVLCHLCERARPAFRQAIAYGVYEGTLRSLIHLLKYERVSSVAAPLGTLLGQCAARITGLPNQLTVVPVPLHATKKHERSFNQSALLGEHAMRALNKLRPELDLSKSFGALARLRGTESQSRLTPHQRRRNLRGAFFVTDEQVVRGRSILLLDDIYTTGATARECTKTLLKAGAAAVYVATLARSQREGIARWEPTAISDQRSRKTAVSADFA